MLCSACLLYLCVYYKFYEGGRGEAMLRKFYRCCSGVYKTSLAEIIEDKKLPFKWVIPNCTFTDSCRMSQRPIFFIEKFILGSCHVMGRIVGIISGRVVEQKLTFSCSFRFYQILTNNANGVAKPNLDATWVF